MPPTSGCRMPDIGMNAGIADATNLAWLLAARLQGWAEEAILDAYEAERQPITEQVSQFAMDHAPEDDPGARRRAGATSRRRVPSASRCARRLGAESYQLNVAQFCCAGLNFGYFYDRSPIVAADGEAAPAVHDGRRSPRRPFPAAGRRTSGSPTGARCTTRSGRATRCCASMRASRSRRFSRRPRRGASRSRWSTSRAPRSRRHTATPSSSAAAISTWPGAETRFRRRRLG